MKNLRDLTYAEMTEAVASYGEKPYRAEQLYGWVFKKGAADIDSMTDISRAFRDTLKQDFCVKGITVVDVKTSLDGARKFLSELEDGSRIESVIIPEDKRLTLCVSTQAGCAFGCAFCMTGMSGFVRNLRLSELTGQVFAARGLLGEGERLTNVVLMGMGEPLANYDNVVGFVNILADPKAFGFSHNKVTISTCGLVPAIKKLAQDTNVNLAVSLNAASDEVRTRLMPINRKYPIEELIGALRAYKLKGKGYVTVEYILMKGINDSDDDAQRLARLLRPIKCKINLIPFNPYPGSKFERPDEKRVAAFWKIVHGAGYTVIVRHSKGAEIQAACGQLHARYGGGAA